MIGQMTQLCNYILSQSQSQQQQILELKQHIQTQDQKIIYGQDLTVNYEDEIQSLQKRICQLEQEFADSAH